MSGRPCAPPACAPDTPCRRTSSPTPTSSTPSSPRQRHRPPSRCSRSARGWGCSRAACSGAGATVTAVELDRGLAAFLRERFADPLASGQLTLVEGDALDQDLPNLVPPPYDVVANLPYHITSPILHRLLGEPPRPGRLVLMVQREVAERIAAPPGKMSYLSVFVQYHARVRVAFHVPPGAFEPEPAVDSAVIVVEPFDEDDRLPLEDEDALWRLVQAGFRERRKMLHNVLSRQLPVDAGRVDAALADGRHRAGPTTADARRGGVAGAARGDGSDRLGPARPARGGRRPAMSDPAARLTPVVRLAPAKLNLTLAVVGRRDDGFHDLHSVFVPLALADRLSLAAGGRADALHVRGADWVLPRRTSCCAASRPPERRSGEGPGRPATPALAARLEKHIPVAAGLGGGSSDGAAAFDGALEAWGASDAVDAARRRSAAASIGSDVPFFLAGGPALIEGRGERVTALRGIHGHPGVLLVTPAIALRTPGRLRGLRRDPRRRPRRRLGPDDLGAPRPGARQRPVGDRPHRPCRGPRLGQRPARRGRGRGARPRRRSAGH